jgi:hypothetical protein
MAKICVNLFICYNIIDEKEKINKEEYSWQIMKNSTKQRQ